MSTQTKLTAHLTALSTPRPYAAATEHAFLAAAAQGTLPKTRLALFLAQDRLYAAHGYPRFIGRLITAIPWSNAHAYDAPEEAANARVLRELVYALQNVVREVGFFGDVADKFGLELKGWVERKATRDYAAEMARVATEGTLADGLVFLWAMERVYLDAWTFVKMSRPSDSDGGEAGPALAVLVDNWTNEEFVKFVDNLAVLVDELDLQSGSKEWLRAQEIWARVVELEESFWPLQGEESSLRAV